MEKRATPEQIDAALDAAAIKQLTWKPSVMRNIAIKICVRALNEDDRIFWSDDIDFSFVDAADRNCIGGAWRMLVKAGIVKRTDLNRRSTKEASKGRVIFKYRLASAARAKTFLQRNGWTGTITAKGERLLFPLEEMTKQSDLMQMNGMDPSGLPREDATPPPDSQPCEGAPLREHTADCMCHLCLPGSRP